MERARLVREVSDLDAACQPSAIEEAFKRLKHRLNLEHISRLSQLAACQDFAAKIFCDDVQALATQAVCELAALAPTGRINRAYAHSVLTSLFPALLLAAPSPPRYGTTL